MYRIAIVFVVVAFGIASVQCFAATPASADISIDQLHPGMHCRVWTKASDDAGTSTAEGKIKTVTKDEIVLITGISEGRNEVGIPILDNLPFIGHFFRRVTIGREEITAKIPSQHIARIEPLEAERQNH